MFRSGRSISLCSHAVNFLSENGRRETKKQNRNDSDDDNKSMTNSLSFYEVCVFIRGLW